MKDERIEEERNEVPRSELKRIVDFFQMASAF